jgi:hypothetical protein
MSTTAEQIIQNVARAHGLTAKEVTGTSQLRRIVAVRHKACLALHRLGLTSTEIAAVMNRERSTITNSLRRARAAEQDQHVDLDEEVEELEPWTAAVPANLGLAAYLGSKQARAICDLIEKAWKLGNQAPRLIG